VSLKTKETILQVQTTDLSQRRQFVARGILGLSQHRGPLARTDQERMDGYIKEMDEINLALRHDYAARYASEFNRWLRMGVSAQTPEHHQVVQEYRATLGAEGTATPGAAPSSGGAYFAPIQFTDKLASSMKWSIPFFEPGFCDFVQTPTGTQLPFPTDSDAGTVTGEQLAEGNLATTADVTSGQGVLGSYKFSSKLVPVSNEMLNDSRIDIEAYLGARFSSRLVRALASPLTTGSGSGGPTGCLYGLTPALTAAGSSDTTGSGSTPNSVGLGDLVSLEQALDPYYRRSAKFMMHPSSLASLKTVKDESKRRVFESLDNGMLLGYQVALNTAMDQLQSSPSSPVVNKIPIAFGDFSYFKVRRATPMIMRNAEAQAEKYITSFVCFWRVDSQLVQPAAIQTLQTTY